MSLHTINRSTKSHPGGGLPFYDKIDYVFSALNEQFNSSVGLWYVPTNKVPVFQLFNDWGGYVTSLVYHETRGNNDFTGTTFVVTSAVQVEGLTINGIPNFCFYTSDVGTLITPAPEGRWVAILTINDTTTPKAFYSEEFTTKNCCG